MSVSGGYKTGDSLNQIDARVFKDWQPCYDCMTLAFVCPDCGAQVSGIAEFTDPLRKG